MPAKRLPVVIVLHLITSRPDTKVAASFLTLPTVTSCSGPVVGLGNGLPGYGKGSYEVFGGFKLQALNPAAYGSITQSRGKATSKPASDVFRIFLCHLYKEIRLRISSLRLGMAERWTETDIDFVFSVPSIARERGAEALFAMAKECNFETVRGRHRVAAITLTEPEAAGFFLLNKHEAQMKEGDIALILDLGGGTLDLSMMALSEHHNWKLVTDFVECVSSKDFRAAAIDRGVTKAIEDYLTRHGASPSMAVEIAQDIVRNPDYFPAKIDRKELRHHVTGIEHLILGQTRGEVYLQGTEIVLDESLFVRLFDELLLGKNNDGGISGQAINMRDDLYTRDPFNSASVSTVRDSRTCNEDDEVKFSTIDYVFFAGGLGGNPYARTQIQEQLQASRKGFNERLCSITERTQFVQWDETDHFSPQLCVAMGLVQHHVLETVKEGPKKGFKI